MFRFAKKGCKGFQGCKSIKYFLFSFILTFVFEPVSVSAGPGVVVPATNLALPTSYKFMEYHYPEPADAKACGAAVNATATLGKVYLAQTHVMEPSWPFFFLIAKRPALIQVIVTGTGTSPDVSVQGKIKGVSVGILCLSGPATLPATVVAATPSLSDRFSATLPAAWMQLGLSLEVKAGTSVKIFTEAQLKVGAAPEINLVQLPIDILDWNAGKPDIKPPADLLPNFASAYPGTMVRLGTLPTRMILPTLIVHSDGNIIPVVLDTKANLKGVPTTNIAYAAEQFLGALKHATGDYAYAYLGGNLNNMNMNGWGGDKEFVGGDYDYVFIHEMGHAMDLPHWDNAQANPPNSGGYLYPYGGTTNDGGGRGETWNYYQNLNEFISPICGIKGNVEFGKERSDMMFRPHHCLESRLAGPGTWDGLGDFSAYAMYRSIVGADSTQVGTIPYRGGNAPYYLPKQEGFPTLKMNGSGARILERANQPLTKQDWEQLDFLIPQKWDTPVYTVYGSFHPQYTQANILYDPLAYIGDLPRVINPTDPATFTALAAGGSGPFQGAFYWEKDMTFKFTYADGSVLTAIYPYSSLSRNWKAEASLFRRDIIYFAINIPADKLLKRIELYKRPFVVRGSNDTTSGNIANPRLAITASNFMNGATLIMGKDVNVQQPLVGVLAQAVVSKSSLAYRLTAQGVEFSGLSNGAVVEIFDSQGKLMGRLPEHGGFALWTRSRAPDGMPSASGFYWARTKDISGRRVRGAKILFP